MHINPARPPQQPQMNGSTRFGIFVSGFLFAIFGLLTIQYAVAIVDNTKPWLYSVLYYLIQYPDSFEPGYITVEQNLAKYRELMPSMSSHALLGGLLVMLGIFQFVPSFRRKRPKLHRVTGTFLLVCMTAVCVSGIHFLSVTTPTQNFSGQAFYFTLFAVAVMSLGLISQAVLAVVAKDFRSHMVWIGLAFCGFLTAPLLRLNYLIVGGLDPQVLNRLVQNSSPTVLLQAFVLWMLWLVFVGDKDLPARAKDQTLKLLPEGVVKVLAWLAAFSLLGLFLIYVAGTSQISWLLVIFIVSRLIQTLSSIETWKGALKGRKPTLIFAVSTVVSIGTGLLFASTMDTSEFTAHAIFYCLVHFALLEMVLMALAFTMPNLGTGVQVFSLCHSAMSWMWLGFPGVIGGLWLFGFETDVGLISSYVLVPPMLFVLAIVVATSSRIFLKINQPVSGKHAFRR